MFRLLNLTVVLFVMLLLAPLSALCGYEVDYSDLNSTLNKYVKKPFVDYEGLVQDHEALDQFVGMLMRIPTDEIDNNMTRDERLAFWINSFNALTLKGIVEAWPTMSIKRIDGYQDRIWTVAGHPTTLDNIRVRFLGKELGDPRAFMATCDGTAGAPPLQPYAFDPDSIDVQLDRVTHSIFNNPKLTQLDPEAGELKVNANLYVFREFIQKKYPDKGQFASLPDDQAAVLNFVLDFAEGQLKAELEAKRDWKLSVVSYMWMLNSDKRPPVPKAEGAPIDKPNR